MVPTTDSIFPMKTELPSSQLLSQNSFSEWALDAKLKKNSRKKKMMLGIRPCSTGLLEDLLSESQNFGGESSHENMKRRHILELEEDKPGLGGFGSWSDTTSISLSSGQKI